MADKKVSFLCCVLFCEVRNMKGPLLKDCPCPGCQGAVVQEQYEPGVLNSGSDSEISGSSV